MKIVFSITALVVLGFGCATKNVQPFQFDPNITEKNISQRMQAEPIPLPATTPFDFDAVGRKAYFNGFHKAWDYVATGLFLHATMGVTKPTGLEEQWDAGWNDGYKLAVNRWEQERNKLQAESNPNPNSSP